MEKKFHKHHQRQPLAFAILLVIIGVVILALNFSAKGSSMRHILFSWQMVVLVVGFITALNRKYLLGIYLILVAHFFAMPSLAKVFPETLSWVEPDFLKTYWALLLVVAGIFIIIQRISNKKRAWNNCLNPHFTSSENKDGFIRREIVFSGTKEIFSEPVFQGAKIKCTFGGAEIDLRKTSLPEGDTFVRVKCTFGGLVLIVPESWDVDFQINNVFGGSADSRVKNCEIDTTRRLVITGECVFGGCEIK
jgi:predicted membrane protein